VTERALGVAQHTLAVSLSVGRRLSARAGRLGCVAAAGPSCVNGKGTLCLPLSC
jgi:hypothetical protein